MMLHAVPRSYQTPEGKVYTPFLRLSERPHILIAGATGSGKSVALNGIIHSLLMTHSPFTCQFVLIDPKKVELSQFRILPHTAQYADNQPDIVRALSWALDETDRRFSVMQKENVKEFSGSHLYVVIDELADLMVSMKKETLPLLQRLVQIGRAAKVHVIACTQNVLAITIPTVLKCNFSTILGLRTVNKQQSRYLIAEPGCEMLPDPKREGKGYCFVRDGADLTKILVHKYPDEEIQRMIDWWTSSACIAN